MNILVKLYKSDAVIFKFARFQLVALTGFICQCVAKRTHRQEHINDGCFVVEHLCEYYTTSVSLMVLFLDR